MFLYPALAAGFAFLVVPPVVHLINMLRHRRQRWAAMDFLISSYRRQRRWIRLRQLLLLLARMAAAALLVAMLAGWTGTGPVASLLGGQTYHHVIVLDDSVSMGAGGIGGGGMDAHRSGVDDPDLGRKTIGGGAYGRALSAIADLTRRVGSQDGMHQLTVIRTSRAALAVAGGGGSADAAADVTAAAIDGSSSSTGERRSLIGPLLSTSVSSTTASPEAALKLASALIQRIPADKTTLYVASDFRDRDWASPEKMIASLQTLPSDVAVRLIDCEMDEVRPGDAENLAITDLSPRPDVWVAGVPVVMEMTVRNFGRREATSISPTIRVIRYDDSILNVDVNERRSGIAEEIPAAVIPSIPAGGEVQRTFQVFVANPGVHAVEVSLPADRLAADNTRVCTLPLTDAEKVLVIDGGVDGLGGLAIASALDPGSQVRIGAVPEVRQPSYLRDVTADSLSMYRAVYLTDVEQFSESTAKALSDYVQRGGGLAIFVGSDAVATSYDSALLPLGLMPGELKRVRELADATDRSPDLRFGEAKSPITDPLRSVGENALSLVSIEKSWELSRVESATQNYKSLLQRRDGLDWMLSTKLGNGQVVVGLTGLSGQWTNWSGDPTFVVFLLQTNAALYSGAAPSVSRLTTQTLRLNALNDSDPANLPITSAQYFAPTSPPRSGIEVTSAKLDQTPQVDPVAVQIDGGTSLDEFLSSGLGEWAWSRSDGSLAVRPVATVIDPSDGNLSRVDSASLLRSMAGIDVTMMSSTAWSEQSAAVTGSTLSLALLIALAVLLALEQWLGWWASYHAPVRKRTEGGGPPVRTGRSASATSSGHFVSGTSS